jgi:pimeloyl-ACP methyl ester carboxylesterase
MNRLGVLAGLFAGTVLVSLLMRGMVMAYTTEVVREGTITLEHYIPAQCKSDKKLLFVHSSGHGSWMWTNFLSYFAEKGFDAWAINLRGHHLSDPVEVWEEVGVAEYLEDIEQGVNRIGGKVVLIGHSMSGLLLLKYAESHQVAGLIVSQSGIPRAMMQKRGIVLEGPAPGKGQRAIEGGALLPIKDRESVKVLLFDEGNAEEETVDLVIKMMGKESARVGEEIMNMELVPEKISVPLFVLGFDASKIGMRTSVDLNKVLAEELNARDYTVIEPGGHDYMLEKNWERFAQQFEVWIHSLEGAGVE